MRNYSLTSPQTLPLKSEHIAWILLYLNLLMLFPRSGSSVTSLDPQTAFRILMVVGAGSIAALSLFGNANALRALVKPPLLAFFIFSVVALSSSSYASVQLYSMWKGLEIVVDVLVIAIIIGHHRQRASVNKAYNLILLMIGLTAASAWIGMLVNPGFAFTAEKGLIPFRIQGYYPILNSNSLGTFSAISALVAIIRLLNGTQKRALYTGIFLAMFITMILTTSRTALFSFALGLMTYSFFSKQKVLFYSLIGVIALISIGGVAQDFASEWFKKGQADSTLQSLSGRTRGWTAAWDLFKQSPLGGHGIASAGRFDVLEGGKASTLHGSFFDVIVGVGIVGTAPWLIGIFYTGYRLLRPAKVLLSKLPIDTLCWRAETLALYAFLLVRGFTSSGLALHEKEFMLLLALTAIANIGFGITHDTSEDTVDTDVEPVKTAQTPDNILRRRTAHKDTE